MNPFESILIEHGLGDWVSRIIPLALPAARLVATRFPSDNLTTGASKIGGSPDLPVGSQWPRRDGRPLTFIAQLDLSEASRVIPTDGLLPHAGHLLFFYDAQAQPWGFDPKDRGCSSIIYAPAGARLDRTPRPEFDDSATPKLHGERAFAPCSVAMLRVDTWPGHESLVLQRLGLGGDQSFDYAEALSELEQAGDPYEEHQFLGYASDVQGEMQTECALVSNGYYLGNTMPHGPRVRELEATAESWRLLLQIGSDQAPGMMWGDCGMVYFGVRGPSLRDRSFSEAWTVLQCG